jgi:uncharacterized protein GlcG (DUF336 family)
MKKIIKVALLPVAIATAVNMPNPRQAQTNHAPLQLQSISLEQADAMIVSARATASRLKVNVSIMVLDVTGTPVIVNRMNGAGPVTLEGAQMKANTALTFGAPTKDLVAAAQPGAPLYGISQGSFSKPMLFVPGGIPIRSGANVIGAVGVGGAQPDQDHQIAAAAIAAIK